MNHKITILGAGTFGTAIAQVLAQKHKVIIWSHNLAQVVQINTMHCNQQYHPQITLHHNIQATNDLAYACKQQIIFLAVPIKAIRPLLLCEQFQPNLKQTLLVSLAKGIEIESGKIPTDLMIEIQPKLNVAVLVGPNFAQELIQLLPATSTVASIHQEEVLKLIELFKGSNLTLSVSRHLKGLQLTSAYKNIAAIACGMVHHLGMNAQAMILDKALKEATKLLELYSKQQNQSLSTQAKYESILAGLGDIFISSTCSKSRNFSLGQHLIQQYKLGQSIENKQTLCEGVNTIKALAKYYPYLPLTQILHKAIYQQINIQDSLTQLLAL